MIAACPSKDWIYNWKYNKCYMVTCITIPCSYEYAKSFCEIQKLPKGYKEV